LGDGWYKALPSSKKGYFANLDLVRNNRIVISESHMKACAFTEMKLYYNMISSIIFSMNESTCIYT
jgi:hypothetical protein